MKLSRPRPVVTKASITGLLTATASVLTFLGYANAATKLTAETQTLASIGVFVVLAASHILPALSSQKEVTPLASPQSRAGERLYPASAVGGDLTPPPSPPQPTEPDVIPEPDTPAASA